LTQVGAVEDREIDLRIRALYSVIRFSWTEQEQKGTNQADDTRALYHASVSIVSDKSRRFKGLFDGKHLHNRTDISSVGEADEEPG
jgi:hypothetical protein